MKRTERHHLKENELHNLARQAREGFESKRRETTFIIGALAVVGLLAVGYFVYLFSSFRGKVSIEDGYGH